MCTALSPHCYDLMKEDTCKRETDLHNIRSKKIELSMFCDYGALAPMDVPILCVNALEL